MRPLPLAALWALALAAPALAADLDTLGIGPRYVGGRMIGGSGWDAVADTTSFVRYDTTSVWTPTVDVARDLLTPRSGYAQSVLYWGGLSWFTIPAAGAMFDDDGATAYAPLEHDDPPTRPLAIDLGAAFGIDRIRFHPRLDRRHQRLYLQEFALSTAISLDGPYQQLLSFGASLPNAEPVVDEIFPGRFARYLRLEPSTERTWEVAEIEVYSDGTVPVGQFVTRVFTVGDRLPVDGVSAVIWGRVRYEGGPISSAPVFVQTRTGIEREPRLFYEQLVADSDDPADLVPIAREDWLALPDSAKGPVVDNPAWSSWQTVSNNLVLSPALRRYIQVKVLFPLPGTTLKRLVLEYSQPPLFHDLPAEIYPTVVRPGEETAFTLSAIAYLDTSSGAYTDTGFRILDVGTTASVAGVDEVLIDDVPVAARPRIVPGRGFSVDLGRAIQANGTFLQVKFRASVFRDFTRYDVSARETSFTDPRYQIGREEDVDVDADGGQLVVRFDTGVDRSLLTHIRPASPVVSPNGDGINDAFVLNYTLLHVLKAVDVTLDVFDLVGQRLASGAPRTVSAGDRSLSWDGRNDDGRLLPPGLYLYRITVDAANGGESRQGIVAVAR